MAKQRLVIGSGATAADLKDNAVEQVPTFPKIQLILLAAWALLAKRENRTSFYSIVYRKIRVDNLRKHLCNKGKSAGYVGR